MKALSHCVTQLFLFTEYVMVLCRHVSCLQTDLLKHIYVSCSVCQSGEMECVNTKPLLPKQQLHDKVERKEEEGESSLK